MAVRRLGRPRLHLREVDSTNRRARELAAAGAAHGTLVTATAQTAGRGRQGRSWSAPAGRALVLSVVLRDPPALLPLVAAAAVAELAGDSALVKWPNDVLVDGRKVAGILAEGRPQESWAVLGIGVNVAVRMDDLPAGLRGTAGTLGLEPGDVEPCLQRLLCALERWLAAPRDELLAALRARDALANREVRWDGGAGTARGIDDGGRLVVQRADGERVALEAGEVHLASGPPPGDA
ncbi:biotin--[acetyl-CoA-carboxylase] ligase [Capillimicrobium parvum]|uniref:biotin--[biotin carboxyl-carrier protein] ligase n=1 Tax=Capillimicrobium parvum TaxID=2884022 RepID=A0A9E7C7C6_9ACTN|nr:biotin--[acetyl-CoA-carboxylase] ligase [Capillimicrobium parvum]UGS39253.1 Bifunctional ligase/repressor BirA [Capillimicrobium parvum]